MDATDYAGNGTAVQYLSWNVPDPVTAPAGPCPLIIPTAMTWAFTINVTFDEPVIGVECGRFLHLNATITDVSGSRTAMC